MQGKFKYTGVSACCVCRLPSAAFAANQQFLPVRDLLRQIGQQVEKIMQPQAAKEAEAGRPVKRLCIDDRHIAVQVAAVAQYSSPCSSVCSMAQQVVQLLLDTHNSIVLNAAGLNVAWRMEFVDMLHQVKGLHAALLHQLMLSISGGQGELREVSTVHGTCLWSHAHVVLVQLVPVERYAVGMWHSSLCHMLTISMDYLVTDAPLRVVCCLHRPVPAAQLRVDCLPY